jgi:hypothetical protein
MTIRFFALLFSLTSFFSVVRPGIDIAPSRDSGSGDCALISQARANVAPPPNDCKGKKAGDACETYRDTKGICQLICPSSDPNDCKSDEQKILDCVDTETTTP